MRRLVAQAICLGTLCLGPGEPIRAEGPAAPKPAADQNGGWKTERIDLRDGHVFRGLIESEDDAWVNLIQIEQRPGRTTYLVIRPIDRAAIASIERLHLDDRARLQRQIEQFRNRAQIEAGAIGAVRLARQDGPLPYRYEGRWFALDSSIDEEVTRLVIVRVEQIFTAYRQLLPPRTTPQQRLGVRVFGSSEEYLRYLQRLGLPIANPAVFLREPNTVAVGTEMARFAAEYEKNKATIQRRESEVRRLEKQLDEGLRAVSQAMKTQGNNSRRRTQLMLAERRKGEAELKQIESELKQVRQENEQLRERIIGRVLRRLYHEAFHAYLENYVYPRKDHSVPLWLEEGLAMVFEEAFPESGTLRLGAFHREALTQLKDDLTGRQPLSVEEVITAGASDFLGMHGTSAEDSNRYYWYAWGLAYYLTFEQRLLAGPTLDRYLAPGVAALPPGPRFEILAGMPPTRFEALWQKYIRALR